MTEFNLFSAPSATSMKWTASTVSWEDVLEWLESPELRKETEGYVFGRFKGKLRRNVDLIDREVLSLDCDADGAGLEDDVRDLGVRAAMHTTFSSSPADPRWRILLPLSRPVSGPEYEVLAESVATRLGYSRIDKTSFRPAQFMWKPGTQDLKTYAHHSWEGEDLAVDVFIAAYDEDAVLAGRTRRPIRCQKKDPRELGGIVGAFNRVYTDLDELIEEFDLPYVKEGEGRYRYADSDAVAGMGEMKRAPGLYFSHHSTDPAGNQACSAFDLVRIHRFGALDEGSKAPVNRLPSALEMLDVAIDDERAKKEMLQTDFPDTPGGSPGSSAWKSSLDVTPKGVVKPTAANLDLIFANDPLISSVRFNDMSKFMEPAQPFSWALPGRSRQIDDTDLAQLGFHLDRTYKLDLSPQKFHDRILASAQERAFNPLVDWLRGLKWDRKPRLETCLPGVPVTDLSRLIARKALVGAVARAFSPGCQVDFVLVLYGREGVGKSRFFRNLAWNPEWVGELESVSLKDTQIAMSKSWILVSDELDGLNKMAWTQLKSLTTKTHDTFRAPYARSTQQHPRQCVIWGTTNDEKILQNREGNRRFLVVDCQKKDNRSDDRSWVEQVWAEAVYLHDRGERLYFTDEEEQLAKEHRKRFTRENPLFGQAESYLEMNVPETWASMGTEARREWYIAQQYIQSIPTDYRIDTCCALDIAYTVLDTRGSVPDSLLAGIRDALLAQPDWYDEGMQMTDLYGPQIVFCRRPPEEEPDLENLI